MDMTTKDSVYTDIVTVEKDKSPVVYSQTTLTENKPNRADPDKTSQGLEQPNNPVPAVTRTGMKKPRRHTEKKSKRYSVAFGSTVVYNPALKTHTQHRKQRRERTHMMARDETSLKGPKSEGTLKSKTKKGRYNPEGTKQNPSASPSKSDKDMAKVHGSHDQIIASYVNSVPFLVDRSTSMSGAPNSSDVIIHENSSEKSTSKPLTQNQLKKSGSLYGPPTNNAPVNQDRYKRSNDDDDKALNVFKTLNPNRKQDVELYMSGLSHQEDIVQNSISRRKLPVVTKSAKEKVLKEFNKNNTFFDIRTPESHVSRQDTSVMSLPPEMPSKNATVDLVVSSHDIPSSQSVNLSPQNILSQPSVNLLKLEHSNHIENPQYFKRNTTSIKNPEYINCHTTVRDTVNGRPITVSGKYGKAAAFVIPTVRKIPSPDHLSRMGRYESNPVNVPLSRTKSTSYTRTNYLTVGRGSRRSETSSSMPMQMRPWNFSPKSLDSPGIYHSQVQATNTSLPGRLDALQPNNTPRSVDKQNILKRQMSENSLLFDGFYRSGKSSLSDIQGAYSDEEDGQPGNRPYTDSYRGHPFTLGGENRFKKHGADPSDGFVKTVPALHHGKQKDDGTRASLVTFYISGDRNYKGLQLAVSSKTWPNIEKFKDHLTKKIGTTWPIMNIYAIPTGELIDDLIKLQNNRSYIVCKDSKPQLAKIEYGYSHEKHWITKPPSAGKFRKKDISMLKQNAPANSPSKNRRVITIIQNKNRIRKEKVILNPQTSMSFDQILSDMGDMINMNATALYLYKKPETRVTSYSQLFRDFKTVDEFIICGEEMVPVPDSTEQPDYLDYNGDIEQYNDTDYDDRRRWEDPFEQVAYDDSLDTDEESAKKVKVRMRGRYKEYFLPERPTPDNRSKPNGKLLLEWLYGYCSNNNNNSMMVYHKTGELVCYMDAAVVFYNKTFDHQRFYLAHTEEVTCMALHPDGRWIATGQKAGSSPEDVAHIRIWDGRTLSTQVILGVGIFSRGVSSVNFRQNPDGALLCAVDSSDKHILTVWDWNRKRLLAKTTTTTRSVSSACFYPRDDTVLITYGDQHLYFWKLFWDPALDTDGRLLRDKESGSFLFPPTSNLDSDEPREILSIAFLRNGFVATGDSTGAVIIWAVDPTLVCRFLVALSDPHHKPVNSLCFLSNNTLISGGGKEIKAWNTSTNHFRKIHERILVDNAGDVASIVVRDKAVVDGSMPVLYIGTKTSCIFEGSFENKLEKHIDAHFDDVSAVVSHPRENSFYSASMDMTIKKWVTDGSEKRGKPITYDVERPCTCIDIDSKGRYLAVGTSDGHVKILPSALKQKSEINDIIVGTSQPKPPFIMCVKISPERDTLAVGCHDGCVYIYNDVNDPSRVTIRNNTIFKANPCSVINVDWSINSHYIQTMSADYDLFHWDVTDMVATRAIEFRDAEWSTQNVTVGYNVCGVWTNLKDDDEVKVMDRSPNKELVAAGDSKGGIRLYNYPCVGVKPEYKVTRMYSNEVTALSFLARTARLISCGGQKSVLAQWRVEKYITSNEH
ncbi:echinoderm microtubule-associated protein-like CG42247 isoform X2 [Argopecten irradians]|uniref:echinoderm microtubule-associated protein-like CG42247 isoform X2 n=1 Tax=Argopecten irradians TaxID=31199 RepID=UPI00371CD3BE